MVVHERRAHAYLSPTTLVLVLIGFAAVAAFFVERRSWRRHLRIARA